MVMVILTLGSKIQNRMSERRTVPPEVGMITNKPVVAMNFIEIGKWAWSPPRKNASLTIQIYRNDEDPDKGGKYEIKADWREI